MLRAVVAGLKARTLRLVLSTIAVALGVAFVTGSLVLGDAIEAGMRDGFAQQNRGVAVSVTPARGHRTAAPLTTQTLQTIRQVPGVAAADGRETVTTPLVDTAGKAKDAASIALPSDERLRPFDLVEGRYPRNNDEVTLEQHTATESKYALGQRVTALAQDGGAHDFVLVGTFRQSVAAGEHSSALLLLLPDALHTLVPAAGYDEIVVRAMPGVNQERLADDITRSLKRPDVSVVTGEETIANLLRQTAPDSAGFTKFFQAFAVIALIMASVVIYNTFAILIAQRTRELALLRCVGAGKTQVFAGVLAEAVLMGVIASVLGLFGGVGVSALLQLAISSGDAVTVYTPVAPKTILAAGAVGVLVTVLAAVLPAHRATRVAPVAALGSQSDGHEEVARTGRLRVVVAAVLLLAGAGVAVLSVELGAEDGAPLAVLSTVAFLAAVLALGPVLVGPVIGALGALPRRLFGIPAVLASANADRNPKRTAATTAALMIGLAIVSLVTAVAGSVEESTNTALDQQFPVDYTVTSSIYDRPLPAALTNQLASLAEVAEVAPRQAFNGTLGTAGGYELTAVRGDAIGTLVRPSVLSGHLGELRLGELAVSKQLAHETGLAVGDVVPTSSDNGELDLRVVAVYEGASGPGNDLGLAMVDLTTLTKLEPQLAGYESVLIKLKPGVSQADGRAALEKITATSPLAQLASAADIKDRMAEPIRQMLSLLWALIGLTVIIALAGIANTLSLSVLERTRESALLRALGLTRGQLRATLTIESVLMATMGSIFGLALGIGSAWLIIKTVATPAMPITFTVPVGQIGVMVLVAILAAPLAAALPARRAARSSITAGMVHI
jgi:putative ABC transport system permease protein